MVKVKTMTNYIRACFCRERPLDFSDLKKLERILKNFGFHFIDQPLMNQEQWIEQPLIWKILNQNWLARLFQISPNQLTNSMISIDVDSLLFLPERKISYHPIGDPLFDTYKYLLVDLIEELRPFVGLIDYDEDLVCGELRSNSFMAWGNYLSSQFLETWTSDEVKLLRALVDEYIKIEEVGILTFNHPLGYGENKENQIKFWNIINSHVF